MASARPDSHQLHSLIVARVRTDGLGPKPSAGRKAATPSKGALGEAAYTQERLLVLTCDSVALLDDDDPDAQPGHRSPAKSSSGSSLGVLLDGQAKRSHVAALPLSQIREVTASGARVVAEYFPTAPFPRTEAPAGGGARGVRAHGSHVLKHIFEKATAFAGPKGSPASVAPPDADEPATKLLTMLADSPEAAEELAGAITAAMGRMAESLEWLDRGLPIHTSMSVAVASVGGPLQGLGAQAMLGCDVPWGAALAVPACPRAGGDQLLHLALSTPLRACYASVPVARLAALAQEGGGLLDLRARPHPAEAGGDGGGVGVSAAAHRRFAVQLTLSVEPAAAGGPAMCAAGLQPTPLSVPPPAAKRALPRLPSWALPAAIAQAALALLWPPASPRQALVAAFLLASAAGALLLGGAPAPAPAAAPPAAPPAGACGRCVVRVLVLRASIVEGEEEEEEGEGEEKGKVDAAGALRRSLTRSLTKRLTKARTGALVDFGAAAFRRVLTTAGPRGGLRAGSGAWAAAGAAPGEAARLRALAARTTADVADLMERHAEACGGDRAEALQRVQATVEWREAHAIDAILATPIPHFAAVKDAYLHAVVGRTRDGRAVLVEGMGSARAAVAKLKPQGVGPEDVVYQFIFTLEWMARVLDPGAAPAGRFVRIYDLKGVKFTDCADKVSAAMGREATQVLESHFPGRMDRAFIVNAPGFFNMLWKVVSSTMAPETAARFVVVKDPKQVLAKLREVMDDDVIPEAYGGRNKGWYESPAEREVRALAARLNAQ